MTPYYEDGGLRLFHGSNKDVLPTFDGESFDSIVCDPPYELGFMGKGWDSTGIAYDVEMWRECFRVLKPGGFLLAFGGTRTWHRIAMAIEDAGFEIRDSIAWMYGQGFPKSQSVSVMIDKALGATREVVGRTKGAASSRTGSLGKFAPEYEQTFHASDEAAAWDGWGTALKPAFEPIVVARKPFVGTVAANVLTHGTGALNIDGCRVPAPDGGSVVAAVRTVRHDGYEGGLGGVGDVVAYRTPDGGRFPPNVLLDESQAAALDEQSGILTSGLMKARTERAPRPGGKIYGADKRNITAGDTYADSGGASRFFPTFRYEAKAPSSERPEVEGVAHATVKPLDLMRWLVRLVTRRGGHVLDPFAGSGTTGEAALLEGMNVTLIELESAHLPLILQRVRKPLQPSMFGDWDAS